MKKERKPIIDISEHMNENKSKYYFSKITNFWYNQTPKVKTYIAGAFILSVGLGAWLGPCGGLKTFKANVTEPLARQITGLTQEKDTAIAQKKTALAKRDEIAGQKAQLEKDYKNVKQEKETYAKEMERYKACSDDANFMNMVYEFYEPKTEYKVIYNFDNGKRVIKTMAVETGEVVKDVKKNMMWCASRLKFELDGIRKYLGEKWVNEYHEKYIRGNLDFVENERDEGYGKDGYVGKWQWVDKGDRKDLEFKPQKRLPLKPAENEGLEGYFK